MAIAWPLIGRLLNARRDASVLLTTVTRTAADLATTRLPPRTVHQYLPLDTPAAVDRFLDHWRPEAGIFVESEFWPTLILEASRRGIALALVNGRMTEKTAARWRRVPKLIEPVLGAFDIVLAQSKDDAGRLENLGAKEPTVMDNLKFAAPPLEADPQTLRELETRLDNRPRWLAASTHEGEETLVARAHQILKTRHPNLISIIAPRHPERGGQIAASIRGRGATVAQRSKGEDIEAETDVYLADTLGELGIFFRLADIVFVGGSLMPRGGQNLLEPARLDCAILHGPHMDNFRDVANLFRKAGAAIEVGDGESLIVTVDQLLSDHGVVALRAASARRAAAEKSDVLDRVMDRLDPILRQAP